MAAAFQTISKEALRLPPRQRYALVNLLLELNEASSDSENMMNDAWEIEIKKRVDQVRSGKVKGKSLAEVVKRLS